MSSFGLIEENMELSHIHLAVISLAVFAQNNQSISKLTKLHMVPISCECYLYWNIIYVISNQIKLYVMSNDYMWSDLVILLRPFKAML